MWPYYKDIINYLEHQILLKNKTQAKHIISQENNFCMTGDLLFRLPRPQDIDRDDRLSLQLVIPDSLAEIVIAVKHDRFRGTGHAGFIKSLMSIKRKYHIHDLASKLQDYLNKYGLWLKSRESKKPKCGVPLRPAAGKSCTGPFQKIQLDFAGPIPPTNMIPNSSWLWLVNYPASHGFSEPVPPMLKKRLSVWTKLYVSMVYLSLVLSATMAHHLLARLWPKWPVFTILTNHLPPVCWSTFWKSRLKRW